VAKKKPPSWQKEKNISRLIWVIVPFIIVLIAGLVVFWGYDNYVAAWRQPVVKVNEVTLDMNYFVKILRFYSSYSSETIDTTTYPYQVLQVIEDNELIRQGASSLNIQVDTDEVTEAIKEFLMPATGDEGNATQPEEDFEELYKQWLDVIQLADDDYRQLVETSLLEERITEYLRENEVPTEAEQVHLNIIPLEDEATASEVSDMLKAGGNFTELAASYSIIDELSQSGGDAGWVPRGIYTELDDVMFSLEVGNITEPISTESGYYIIKVSEKTDSMTITEEFRDVLTDNAFKNWLKSQRDDSIIEEFLDGDKIDWALNKI
jgi:foldase protein PrsA